MTICIGVKVNDGLVFVADSASSILQQGPNGARSISRVYNHGDKVFNLFRGLPICAMTCGLGNFANESISTIVKGFRLNLHTEGKFDPKNYTIEQVARAAFERFRSKFEALPEPIRTGASFEFFIGGYSSNNGDSEVWKIQFSEGQTMEPTCIANCGECSIIWAGQPEACVRLVLGYSSKTHEVLKSTNLSDEQATNLVAAIRRASEAQFLEPAMPVRDAIDLAEFLAQTSASFVKFLPGADTVGGDLDIATVTKFEGFRWIRRKHFYPRELNLETDHVQ